jgi:hypothetical protein
MRHITLICCLLLFVAMPGRKAFAQDATGGQQPPKPQIAAPARPSHFYRLDFTVEEIGADGKITNSRAYSTSVGTELREIMSIRAGSKVPIATGFYSNGKDSMHQYQDLGVNFDAREVHEVGQQLSLNLSAEITGLAEASEPGTNQPVIRQNRWQGFVLIPVGKSTVVFSSDSLDSKGSTRISVKATPLQ